MNLVTADFSVTKIGMVRKTRGTMIGRSHLSQQEDEGLDCYEESDLAQSPQR